MKTCASVKVHLLRGALWVAALAFSCWASPFAVVIDVQGASWRNLDYHAALQVAPQVGDILHTPARLFALNPGDQVDLALAHSRATVRLRGAVLEHLGRVLRLQGGHLELHAADEGALPILEAGSWALRPGAGSRLLLEVGVDGVVRWQCLSGQIRVTDQRSGRSAMVNPTGKLESSL